MVDTIAITRGKGTTGVIKRLGVTKHPNKTHRGNKKVVCIEAWHLSAVKCSVARTGQLGYYHRTQLNNKIYRVGSEAVRGTENIAFTEADPCIKNITPVEGIPHYGVVNQDFLLFRGDLLDQEKDKSQLENLFCSQATLSIP